MNKSSIMIWGAGASAERVVNLLNMNTIIRGFIDNSTEKQGKEFQGKKIFAPSEVTAEEFDYIVIGSIHEREIRQQLEGIGIPSEKIVGGVLSGTQTISAIEIFDIEKLLLYQNSKIFANQKEILNNLSELEARNKFIAALPGYEWNNQNKVLSLGGWAVGYDYMYVLMRALNVMKPRNILECGLGQSTKVLSDYVEYYHYNCETFEQNEEWLEFFSKENVLSEHVKIHLAPLKLIQDEETGTSINTYEQFETLLDKHKYDFITIDGPWGSKKKSRIEILRIVPDYLETSFCIMMDDCEREGEMHTIQELRYVLEANHIDYVYRKYSGKKEFCMIVSPDYKFLCSI